MDRRRHVDNKRPTQFCDLGADESPIQRLPPEILSLVFQHAAPPINFEFPEYPAQEGHYYWGGRRKYSRVRLLCRLATVSILWRDIINSRPELWTSFAIRITPRKLKAKTAFLSLCFGKSGTLDVDLKVKFKGFFHHHFDRSEELLHLFAAHAYRIKSLRLGDPPSDLANQLDERFTSLEYVRVV